MEERHDSNNKTFQAAETKAMLPRTDKPCAILFAPGPRKWFQPRSSLWREPFSARRQIKLN